MDSDSQAKRRNNNSKGLEGSSDFKLSDGTNSVISGVDGDSKPRSSKVTGNEPFDKKEREEMEKLLRELRGPLGK